MLDLKGLLHYYFEQYSRRTSSIFLDGLVGGMFLSYLLDIAFKCDDKLFIATFFYISIAHYCSKVIEDMGDYSRAAAASDGRRTRLERLLEAGLPYLLHLVRLVQLPLLLLLTYEVGKLLVKEGSGLLVHDMEEARAKQERFCEGNDMHLAVVTVAFQFFYGFLILLSWTVCWNIDSEDDEVEREEEEAWRREEAEQGKSVWGNFKEFVLVVGMESFFDGQVSGTFMSLALALPHESCNIHVTEWFLMAGVVATLTEVINDLRQEVERCVGLDKIINKAEHRLIVFLKAVRFPLFCAELAAFFVICTKVGA